MPSPPWLPTIRIWPRKLHARIKVEYEVLPHVLDGKAAMSPAAPILLADLRTDALGQQGDQPTNVAQQIRHARGDLAAGFAAAAVVVEREFHTASVHQGYIEPHSATALWNQDDQIQVWCSTQGAFGVQEQMAEILALPVSRITVTPTEIGGGFGGKNPVYLEPVAALLSRKAGHRPVKLTMTRAEVLAATGPTSGSTIRVKMGADHRRPAHGGAGRADLRGGGFPWLLHRRWVQLHSSRPTGWRTCRSTGTTWW